MTTYQQSAIIGYWRCGANIFEIAGIMEINHFFIKHLIDDYEATINEC